MLFKENRVAFWDVKLYYSFPIIASWKYSPPHYGIFTMIGGGGAIGYLTTKLGGGGGTTSGCAHSYSVILT